MNLTIKSKPDPNINSCIIFSSVAGLLKQIKFHGTKHSLYCHFFNLQLELYNFQTEKDLCQKILENGRFLPIPEGQSLSEDLNVFNKDITPFDSDFTQTIR